MTRPRPASLTRAAALPAPAPALAQSLALVLALVALPAAASPGDIDAAVAPDGTTPAAGDSGAVEVMGFQFRPVLHSTGFAPFGDGYVHCTDADLPWFDAAIDLPDQVQIDSLVLWGAATGSAVTARLYSFCTPGAAGSGPTPVMAALADLTSAGHSASFRVEQPVTGSVITDTLRCTYNLRVQLGACSNSQRLGRVRVNYSH